MTARLTISLSSLKDNYRHLSARASNDVAGVVKANAYGLGVEPVAHSLWACGCREFFVATMAEGIELRRILREAKIYVLAGVDTEQVGAFVRHEITPVLNTLSQLEAWQGQDQAAAIHVDTGMHRLGLTTKEALNKLPGVDFPIALLMSHFARADQPNHKFSKIQKQVFFGLCRALTDSGPALRVSLCNSAGMLAGLCGQDSESEDLGRGGIALYGGNPFPEQTNPMAAVVKLEGQILQVRSVSNGQAVGYGGTYVAGGTHGVGGHSTVLATVGLGYADGIPRLLSNRGRVFLNGCFAPIVGRISMDLLHIDISHCDAREGDWVEIFGQNILIDECADHAQTLSYEVLTGLGHRAQRHYINAALA